MANLEIEGRISQKFPVQSGQSARGLWEKQDFVLEYQDGNFPASACFTAFGSDKVKELAPFKVGDAVKVAFNLRGREYNGRWYNDLRVWKVTAAVFEDEIPETIEEKKRFLLRNHIALWDVIRTCQIRGSSDASIENVQVNDLSVILDRCDIRRIFVNGKTAERLYRKYMEDRYARGCICLPSTSPANAAWNLEKLIESWRCIRE